MIYFVAGFVVGVPLGIVFLVLGFTFYDILDENYPKGWWPVDKVPAPEFIKKQAKGRMKMINSQVYELKRASRKTRLSGLS